MKMKKLTALTLAGVLCLGMSTTAFASPSVDQGTADENVSAIESDKVTSSGVNISQPGNEMFEGWMDEGLSEEERSEKITESFEKELNNVTSLLEDEDYIAGLTTKEYKQLQEKQAILEELADPDVKYELAVLEDLILQPGVEVSEDDPVTVRFDLNGKFEDIEAGQVIRILHLSENGQVWEMYETTVMHDNAGYYAEWDFTHFSPVAVLRVTETGVIVEPSEPQSPITPSTPSQSANGSIVKSDEVTGDPDEIDPKLKNTVFDDWTNETLSTEKRSQKINESFENELKKVNKSLEDEDYVAGLTTKQYKQLQDKQAVLEKLADPNVKYELATLEELTVNPGVNVSEDNPVTVRFDLNGRFEDIEEGQLIRILHLSENGNVWEIYETVVKHDYSGYYAEWDFTHFSPVAVLRVTATGTNTDPIIDDPTLPSVPADSSVDGNGSLTADQLADLIVQRLQQNANVAAASVVRNTGKPSPKTGE